MNYPRKSRVLETMRAGKKALCYKSNLTCPRVAEIVGLSGFDALWICQEHVATDQSTMESMILAAKAHDMDVIVRVAKGCYSDYIRPLETDASGIMVPHLMSLDEAEYIARTVRYAPVGLRPLDGGNADGLYCMLGGKDYLKFCNENRLVIVQIEDPEPLSELDKICQVPGIDMIFFGPGDFSQAIGDPFNFDNPEIARVRQLVVKTAHKYGKFAGTVSVPSLKSCYEEGFDFVNCGADVVAIGNNCREIRKMYEESITTLQ
ncbi:MAG: aldolase [Lentisphaeria bacterium]|nr:aldolase [Lentisphaeria bacterium]